METTCFTYFPTIYYIQQDPWENQNNCNTLPLNQTCRPGVTFSPRRPTIHSFWDWEVMIGTLEAPNFRIEWNIVKCVLLYNMVWASTFLQFVIKDLLKPCQSGREEQPDRGESLHAQLWHSGALPPMHFTPLQLSPCPCACCGVLVSLYQTQ